MIVQNSSAPWIISFQPWQQHLHSQNYNKRLPTAPKRKMNLLIEAMPWCVQQLFFFLIFRETLILNDYIFHIYTDRVINPPSCQTFMLTWCTRLLRKICTLMLLAGWGWGVESQLSPSKGFISILFKSGFRHLYVDVKSKVGLDEDENIWHFQLPTGAKCLALLQLSCSNYLTKVQTTAASVLSSHIKQN